MPAERREDGVAGPAAVKEVGEDAVRPGQDDMRGDGADGVGIVIDAGGALIGGPTVGPRGRARGDFGLDDGVQAGGGEGGYGGEAHPAGPVGHDLDGAGNQYLALSAAAAASGDTVFPGPVRDRGLVDFDDACQADTVGRDHRPVQLGAEQPGRLVRAQSQVALQSAGRNAVGIGGHHIARPEPDRERELGAVQHRGGGDRGLPAAGGALPGERLGGEFPSLAVPAPRAAKALGPADRRQPGGTRRLVGKAAPEGEQGAEMIGRGGRSDGVVRSLSSASDEHLSPHFVAPEPGDKPCE